MAGYNELAYLHPKRFKADKNVLDELGVTKDEKYVIIRFVAWNASHDLGHKGISIENKINAVKEFSKYAKVFISSEKELPKDLNSFQLPINPSRIHDAIAFSTMVYGESSTMSEEAAMLGVPSIYLNNDGTYYTNHLEKDFGLMYNLTESEEDQIKAINLGVEILKSNNTKNEWGKKRDELLSRKIDVTSFLIWIVNNYPQCINTLKENPDYQYNFK